MDDECIETLLATIRTDEVKAKIIRTWADMKRT